MMESSKLANWLQILGNFGLIVGLILVAIQIRQSSEIAHAQIVSDGFAIVNDIKLAIAGEEPGIVLAKAIAHPEELSDEEMVKVNALLSAHWYTRIRTEYLSDKGFSFGTPETYGQGTVSEFLDNPYGLAWWEEKKFGFGRFAPKTRDVINDFLAKEGEDVGGETESLNRIRENLKRMELSSDR